MTVRTYSSPQAFKEAVEQRLRSASKNGVDFARRRQLLVFDRFLARIVAVLRDAVLLKGGLVLELRLDRARTTKDIDLRQAYVTLAAYLLKYFWPRTSPVPLHLISMRVICSLIVSSSRTAGAALQISGQL